MKRLLLSSLPFVVLAYACGGSAPVGVATPTGAAVPAPAPAANDANAAKGDAKRETVAASAPAPGASDAKGSTSLDPLGVDAALEAAMVPKVVLTPAKELRHKSRGDITGAMSVLSRESTSEGAVKKVSARLGKPTWIENGNKYVWVAKEGKTCHRFVLDADGQAETDSVSADEWRSLTAVSKQNVCTGEIKRGALGD